MASAATTQTNYGTGDGSMPGALFDTTGNLLSTNLSSAPGSGTFYQGWDSSHPVDLTRLSDGQLGPGGSEGLGASGAYTVMPNVAVALFDFDGASALSAIRTYAMWNSGRGGQSYTVNDATAAAPSTFVTLFTLTPSNQTDFPLREDFDWQTYETICIPDEERSLIQANHHFFCISLPISPPSGPHAGHLNGLHSKSNFLAIGHRAS